MARRTREPLLALLLILAVLGWLETRAKTVPLHLFDQPYYIGLAYDLRHAGLFSTGYTFDSGASTAMPPPVPGMRFAPLYPALLAAAAAIDRPFAAALDCAVLSRGRDPACRSDAGLVRGAQFAMLASTFWLIWWMAGAVTGDRWAPWIALGLALIPAPRLIEYVNYLMTEITALFLLTAATAAGLRWIGKGGWLILALSGLLLGLATLTRPANFYLAPAICLAGVFLAFRNGRGGRHLLLFAAAFVVAVVPWMTRNAAISGHFALTAGYDSHTLAQRISFDGMSWREYALSYVCWLPDGNGLGRALAGPGTCNRFGWDAPDSFYVIGNGAFMDATVAAAGGWDHHLAYLLRTYITPHLLWHAATTLPLAMRGALIDHWWGLVLGIACLIVTARALRRHDWPFLAITGPPWFMLVFAAAVAVNQERYNFLLVAPYAIAGAMLIPSISRRTRRPAA